MGKKVIYIAFPLLCLSMYFFSGCKDTTDQLLTELTEVSFEKINNAILNATQEQNPIDIKISQSFKYESNYQVEMNQPQINSTYEGEVLDIENTEEHFLITVLETDTTYDEEGQTETDRKEETYKVDKVKSNILYSQLPKGIYTQALLPELNINAQGSKLKAYNLKVSQSKIPYPLAVQKRKNCDPNSPCLFNGIRIQFILHEVISKNKTLKVAIDRIYIKKGLFLAGLYSNCQSQFVEIGDRDYHVKQCSVLRDFIE